MIVAVALICTSLAALTGILAVGSGRHWQFDILDYFRGKRNAVLYLWVTASSILSIYLSGVLLQYGIENNWRSADPNASTWFTVHSIAGVLFVFAHLFVATTLSKEVGPVDKYLWGKGKSGAI